MNLLLLQPENMLSDTLAEISGRQVIHIHKTLNVQEGSTLTVGLLNEKIGLATLVELKENSAKLDIFWT